MAKQRRDVEQEITDRIISHLEKGSIPWAKDWTEVAGWNHHNAITKHVYRGINVLLTMLAAEENGWKSNQWVTFQQAKQNGGNIIKGEKSTLIIFNKPIEIEDESAPEGKRTIWMARGYSVFNLEQTEGLDKYKVDPGDAPAPPTPDEFDDWVKRTGIYVKHEGNQPCYVPMLNIVKMPPRNQFKTASGYYSTMCHELGHATGHKDRINRDLTGRYGSPSYAKEELVAELCAAFTTAHLGLEFEIKYDENIESHAAYIQSWLKRLRNDKKFIMRAAGQASKASDWLLDTAEEKAHNELEAA